MSLAIDELSAQIEGRDVVKNISMSVNQGEITAILGPNGAGKSELVLAVAGLISKSSGTVNAEGKDLTNLTPADIRGLGVAVIPEGHRVLSRLSVDDNLRAAASGMEVDLIAMLERVYSTFPELAERKEQLAGSMSGGQQQMLAIGHALMCDPKYLLIDEMSLGLAPLVVQRLANVVRDLKEQGAGIILIEQFTEMALDLADHACVMGQGQLRYSGDPGHLTDNPDVLKDLYLGRDI